MPDPRSSSMQKLRTHNNENTRVDTNSVPEIFHANFQLLPPVVQLLSTKARFTLTNSKIYMYSFT